MAVPARPRRRRRAFLGHVYPVWLGFRGGKGVATFLGALLAVAPPAGLAFIAVWLGVAAITRFSSLAALARQRFGAGLSAGGGQLRFGNRVRGARRHSLVQARRQYRAPAGRDGNPDRQVVTEQLWPDAIRPLGEAERFDWLRLARCDNIGPRSFIALLRRYGSARAALEALPALVASGKSGRPIAIPPASAIEAELARLQGCGAVLVGLYEPDYPALLRLIHAPPPLLAVRGDLACLRRSKVAVVGSRNASAAGLAFTEQISRGLARGGHVIVSGLARGIDARAHQAALETGTIAVLAGGLGNIYPADHAGLAWSASSSMARRSAKCRSAGRRGARFPAPQPHRRGAFAGSW